MNSSLALRRKARRRVFGLELAQITDLLYGKGEEGKRMLTAPAAETSRSKRDQIEPLLSLVGTLFCALVGTLVPDTANRCR